MKLTLPIPNKVSANKIYAGVHWAVRKKIADEYHEAVKEALDKIKMDGGPWIHFEYEVKLKITFYFANRPLDCSNCFFMAKMIEDGLVKSKVLYDDSPQYVSSITCISKVDKEKPRIEVEFI